MNKLLYFLKSLGIGLLGFLFAPFVLTFFLIVITCKGFLIFFYGLGLCILGLPDWRKPFLKENK
jgi:hypothetical protein